jgi:hypothetical protein
MANVRLAWTLPSPNPQQRPIAETVISGRVLGAPGFTELNRVAAPGQELLLQDLASGEWEFQAVVVDDIGQESSPVTTNASIPFNAPDPVTNFTATVE